MAMWLWLLHVGAMVRLRNFVVFMKKKKIKRRGVEHGECRTENSIF